MHINPADGSKWLLGSPATTPVGSPQTTPRGRCPRVQFSCKIFFCDKSEGSVNIDVLRVGPIDGTCTVRFQTQDASAKAGSAYFPALDYVTFREGEHMRTIAISLVQSKYWNAGKEFVVVLSQPEGCTLSSYSASCRVKISDDTAFPSDDFREALSQKNVQEISGRALYAAYFKWNFCSTGLAQATLITLVCDQLSNIYHLVIVIVDMYLVNKVLNMKLEDGELDLIAGLDREQTLYCIAAIHIVPWSVLLLWEWSKHRLNVKGRSMEHLQKEMYRKYMNLSPEKLEEVGPEHLEFGLLTESMVVAAGYEGGLTCFAKMVNILLNIYLVARKRAAALPFVIFVMLAVLMWGVVREHFLIPVIKKEVTQVTHLVKEAAYKHELICQYNVRSRMNDAFETAAQELRDQTEVQGAFLFRTHVLLEVLAPFVIGAYMVLRGPEVINGDLSLGTFLGIIKIIMTVASESLHAYKEFGGVVHTFGMLRNITAFLNIPTEVAEMRDYNRARRAQSAQIMGWMKTPEIDNLPIYCRDVHLSFKEESLLEDLNVKIPQGKLCSLHGPSGSGKNMLLRMLAHMTRKSGGDIFVPSHLRVLLVPRNPIFLAESLLANLSIGRCPLTDEDSRRLRSILQDLCLPSVLKRVDEELFEPEMGSKTWLKELSHAEKHAVSVARALLTNPELLLLQNPVQMQSGKRAEVIMGLLRRHVQEKGLYTDGTTVAQRRPRSVVYTTDVGATSDADFRCELVPTGRAGGSGNKSYTLQVGGESAG